MEYIKFKDACKSIGVCIEVGSRFIINPQKETGIPFLGSGIVVKIVDKNNPETWSIDIKNLKKLIIKYDRLKEETKNRIKILCDEFKQNEIPVKIYRPELKHHCGSIIKCLSFVQKINEPENSIVKKAILFKPVFRYDVGQRLTDHVWVTNNISIWGFLRPNVWVSFIGKVIDYAKVDYDEAYSIGYLQNIRIIEKMELLNWRDRMLQLKKATR